MSDDPATFMRKANAMIAEADAYLDRVGRGFIAQMAWEVIQTTPGPNLQLPETEYIATGRLRAGWHWGLEAPAIATNWKSGPYTEHGDDTLASIRQELDAVPLAAISFLWNDVGYGDIVHWGKGRHPFPRPWVDIAATASTMAVAAEKAVAEALGR